METTFSESGRTNYGDGQILNAQTGDAAKKIRDAGSQEVKNLMADVQDLLGRVAHVADPEIARLKAKVEAGMTTAKQALADGSEQVQRTATNAMKASNAYVREQPWQAVGIAAAAGLLVGFLVGRR